MTEDNRSSFTVFRPRRRASGSMQTTKAALAIVLALLLTTTVVFSLKPEIDVSFSALFFDGKSFPLVGRSDLQAFRALNQWLGAVLLIYSFVLLCFPSIRRRIGVRNRDAWIPFLAYGVGAGVIVNMLLKETFGRARPLTIMEFGGDRRFTEIWEFSEACISNCSFTSGEAAGAAALFSAILVLPAMNIWRRIAIALAISFLAGTLSLNRIAFGAHFLSDVLLSLLIVLAVILASRLLLDRVNSRYGFSTKVQGVSPC